MTNARPSFVSTGTTFIERFSYSNLLFIHTVSCFERFHCWLNSQRSPWHCRRSSLERKQAHKIKIKCQGHAANVILKLSGKNTRSIERKLCKLTSCPPVSKTPANCSYQRRRLWADKCSEGHAQ